MGSSRLHPRHFGTLLGMTAILGEPPPEEVRTTKEIDRAEIRERQKRIIAALRPHAEVTGNAPIMTP